MAARHARLVGGLSVSESTIYVINKKQSTYFTLKNVNMWINFFDI
jgi:hypothetical protein